MSNPLDNLDPEELEHFIRSGGLKELQDEKDALSEKQESIIEPGGSRPAKSVLSTVEVSTTATSNSTPTNPGDSRSEGVEQSNGSYERLTGNEPVPPPNKQEGYAFKDPVELLLFLDEKLQAGREHGGVDLHSWQVQFMVDFASGGINQDNPFQSLVRACNGSGKDKYIIAACAVWLAMCFIRARCVITTASGSQLDTQTCKHITYLCELANSKIHPRCWKINYRHFTCLDTGSPVDCYATDEPGKAEGFHPLDDGCKMALFMSEAKTVPDEINGAFNRCTGYTHRVHASTPGLPLGHFFDACATSVDRKSIKHVSEAGDINYIQYHVTAYECSHLSRRYIEQMKRDLPGGESGAAFRSQVLAEFGTTDEMVVIPYHYVWNATKDDIKWLPEPHNKAGLDLSDGGDETVLVVRNGNKVLKVIPFRFDNTRDTVRYLHQLFREESLDHPDSRIFGDCGGLGKPILDNLIEMGWRNIRYCDNRHKTSSKKVYANWGTQSWFNVRKLFERGECSIVRDDKLIRQLATRYYKIRPDNSHILLSKVESRAKGFPSPDRGDALVLAFADYKSDYSEKAEDKPFAVPVPAKPTSDFNLQEWSRRAGNHSSLESWRKEQFPKSRKFDVYKEAIAHHNEQVKASSSTNNN